MNMQFTLPLLLQQMNTGGYLRGIIIIVIIIINT